MLLLILFTSVTGSIFRGNLDKIDEKLCPLQSPIAATIFPRGELKCLPPKKIFQNAKLKNVNRNSLIYFPHRHFEKYIFSYLKWEKNEFYTHKIGDYLRVIPHKGCLTMVKNKHSAYILRTFGKDPFYRVNTTSTTTHKTTEQTSSEKTTKWTTQDSTLITTTKQESSTFFEKTTQRSTLHKKTIVFPKTTISTKEKSTSFTTQDTTPQKTSTTHTTTKSSTKEKTTVFTKTTISTKEESTSFSTQTTTSSPQKTSSTRTTSSTTTEKTTVFPKTTKKESTSNSTTQETTLTPLKSTSTHYISSTQEKTTKTSTFSSTKGKTSKTKCSTTNHSPTPSKKTTKETSTRAWASQKASAPPKTIPILATTIPICLIILIATIIYFRKKRQNSMNLVGYIYENEHTENTIGETTEL